MTSAEIQDLQRFALQIRIGILDQIKALGFGHIGGSLSIADALAVLYGRVMRYDAKKPRLPQRDKLVCSKGHAGPAVYAALALKGFFPYEDLKLLNTPGTFLPSHCDKNLTPGVDMTTGSLGQGTSLAVGLALADRFRGYDSRTFLIVGDGEANEGQLWEAAMFAAAKKVTNLTWLIDANGKQLDGPTSDVLEPFDFEEKLRAFGFDAVSIDGNDVVQLEAALTRRPIGRPIAIVMHTVKGKGVAEIEQTAANHSMAPPQESLDRWLAQLRAELAALN